MHWNCQGITTYSQSQELHQFITDYSIDIVLLNETFLKTIHKFVIPGYVIHRADRTTHGGGVAIAVRNTIKHKVENSFPTKIIENKCISVDFCKAKVKFVAAYCPRYTSDFQSDLEIMTSANVEFFIAGDFNAHHTSWNCADSDVAGKVLFDHQNKSNYYIYFPPSHTRFPQNQTIRRPSTIDLLLSNSSLVFTDLETHPHKLNSDHVPVTFTVNEKFNEAIKLYPDFRMANWQRFKSLLDLELCNSDVFNCELSLRDVDKTIEGFVDLLGEACSKSVPHGPRATDSARMTAECKLMISTRNKFRRMAQRSTDQSLRTTYQAVVREINKMIAIGMNRSRNIQWGNFLSTLRIGSRNFWKVTRRIKGQNRGIGDLVYNDKMICCNHEKAEILAEHFVNAHRTTVGMMSTMEGKVELTTKAIQEDSTPNDDMTSFTNQEEVAFLIGRLRNGKSPGIDQVSNLLLKQLPDSAVRFLVKVFNFCIKFSVFPRPFKIAKVISIHKKGKDPKSPTSYRPISLLSSIGKVFERIIFHRLQSFVEENDLIHDCQYGFRAQHSTTHQVKRVVKMIRQNKQRRHSTGILFIDIEKAFDSIWHKGLLYKLNKMKFPLYLIKLVNDFLTERGFTVDVEGQQSSIKTIPAGVPQGSVLSPLLYSLYTSDIRPSRESDIAFYADDSAFICQGKVSNAIVGRMQRALNSASKYFSKWKIKINEQKSQAILFPFNKSPKRQPTRKLMANGREIPFSKTIKYLGITLDEKLTFRQHIDSVCVSAVRCGRALFPLLNRKSKLDIRNKLMLYRMCIRPILTYGCQIWNDCAMTHRRKIQIIQNKNLKIIYNLPRRYPTAELHRKSKQKLIETFINDMTLTFNDKCRRSTYSHLRSLV